MTKGRLAELDEMSRVYMVFVNHYTKRNVLEMKIAIESGKEFILRFGNDPEVQEHVTFIRAHIARLEKQLEPCRFGLPNPG